MFLVLITLLILSINLVLYINLSSKKITSLTPHQIRFQLNSGHSLSLVDSKHNHIIIQPLNKYAAQVIILNKSLSQIYYSKTSIAQEVIELLESNDIIVESN